MTETEINRTIADNLKKLRTNTFRLVKAKKGLHRKPISQTQVGKYMNCTFQQIQKYEKGKNQLSASKIYKLSEFFNIPVSSWFSPIEDFYKEIRDENSTDMVLDN